MTYGKSNWREKLDVIKKEGWNFIPLGGSIISKTSQLNNINFENDSVNSIRIMGALVIEQNGVMLKEEEMTTEVVEYYNDLIKGKVLREVKFGGNRSLQLIIETDPLLNIFVDATEFSLPSEKWEWNYRTGYICN